MHVGRLSAFGAVPCGEPLAHRQEIIIEIRGYASRVRAAQRLVILVSSMSEPEAQSPSAALKAPSESENSLTFAKKPAINR
jgi:hypothetical protein